MQIGRGADYEVLMQTGTTAMVKPAIRMAACRRQMINALTF